MPKRASQATNCLREPFFSCENASEHHPRPCGKPREIAENDDLRPGLAGADSPIPDANSGLDAEHVGELFSARCGEGRSEKDVDLLLGEKDLRVGEKI